MASNSKFTSTLYKRGITRFNLLKAKIKAENPIDAEINGVRQQITLDKTSEDVQKLLSIETDEQLLQQIRGKRLKLKTTDGRIISLSQIYKDSIVGKDVTAFEAERATVEALNTGVIKPLNSEWDNSISQYVEKIKEKIGSKKGRFFHESQMVELKQAYKDCVTAQNCEYFSADNISKWNPSDVWFCEGDHFPDFTAHTGSLNELTNFVDSLFENIELVGFSLKKVSKEAVIDLIRPIRYDSEEGGKLNVVNVNLKTEEEGFDKVRSSIWIDYVGKSGKMHTCKLQFDIRPDNIINYDVEKKPKKPRCEVHLYADGAEAKQGQLNQVSVVGKLLGIDNLEQELQETWEKAVDERVRSFDKWEENELPLDLDEDFVIEKADSEVRKIQVAVANRFKELVGELFKEGVENLETNKQNLGRLMSLIRAQFYSENERSCKYYIIH